VKLTVKKMVWIILALVVLLGVVQISIVIGIEYTQQRKNADRLETFSIEEGKTKNLVVYFSHSGNTELMAYKIAEIKRAKIVNLVASDYNVGYKGWINAMIDARKTNAVISPEKLDLSAYDTIYIGSPIWLYSPAPPVFEFAHKNDFTDKKVILFNSMNSKFEQQYIDAFARIITKNGGAFIKHIVVNRGRMTQQMGTEEFLEVVKNKVSQ
jgi:flavodoxin